MFNFFWCWLKGHRVAYKIVRRKRGPDGKLLAKPQVIWAAKCQRCGKDLT